MKKRTLLPAIFLFTFFANSFAAHNVAGTIIYKQIDDNTIEASIVTYTNSISVSGDRDSLVLQWGDGNFEYAIRSNGPDNDMDGIPDGEVLDSFFQMNIYTAQHTYDELGQYTLSMTDPNRSGGILNLNFPNSDMVPFHLETQFNLIPLSGNETNQSPVILEPPIIRAFTGLPYIYTPNAFDIDGDSVVYHLNVPMQGENSEVPNYQFPCEIIGNPPDQSICSLHPNKGLFRWYSPQVPGEYANAILIKSYREGELIDQMILDFMISVEDDPDLYPEIEIENISGNDIIPVNVGDTLRLEIVASDPDDTQEIEINSSCGLYDYFDNPATFEAVTNGNTGTAFFEWIVMDEHVRQQPYQVVIKAADNDLEYSKTSLEVVCYQFEEFITSTSFPEIEIDFQLFPNPVSKGFINLVLKNNTTDFASFTIYDSKGRLIKSDKILSEQTQIDIHFLQPGVYFLTVKVDKSTSTKSIVVQ